MPRKILTVPAIIARHPQTWLALSRQQQNFIFEYVSSGITQGHYDAESAARAAYPKVKHITVWASRLLGNKHIKTILAWHLGLTDAEVLLADIRSLVKRSRRKGANLDILVAPWLRAVAALEAFIAKTGL